jgi:hypothetical protein
LEAFNAFSRAVILQSLTQFAMENDTLFSSVKPLARPSLEFSQMYPHLSTSEAAAAEERFEQYIALALRIYQRLLADSQTRPINRGLTLFSKADKKP